MWLTAEKGASLVLTVGPHLLAVMLCHLKLGSEDVLKSISGGLLWPRRSAAKGALSAVVAG